MKRTIVAAASVGVVVLCSLLPRVSRTEPRIGAAPAIRAAGALQPRVSAAGDFVICSFQGGVWRVPSLGGVLERICDGEGFDIEPAWFGDGRRVAFIRSRNFFSGDLQVVSVSDGTLVELPNRPQVQGKLHVHPDGGRVLGNFQRGAEAAGLGWFDLQSGAIAPVFAPHTVVRRLALSNDGKMIAYATHLDVAGQQSGNDGWTADLWHVASAGGKPQLITRFPARIHDLCYEAGDRALIVTTEVGGPHYDLWRIPLDDPHRGATKLTFGQADEDRPSVTQDGRFLVYTDNREGATTLMRRDLATGIDQPLPVHGLDFRGPAGTIRLHVTESDIAAPIVARVSIQGPGARFYAPPGALYRIERSNGHFYCRGRAELAVPAGEYTIAVSRGPEYRVAHRSVRVEPGKTCDVPITLERWYDAAAKQLYSGENHIHANYGYGEWYNTPESMLLQCQGEDLNVCNFMVANSDGDGVFDREFFRGMPDPLSTPRTVLYWNQEFRSTIWGHMTLVNLKQVVEPVFTGFVGTTNPWDVPTNADIADRTHWQSGLVNYTHPAQNVDDPFLGAYTAKGLPIDVALGKIDTMDVMGSNHRATVPLWYRLLNCGFRIPASAGTDCFVNRVRSRLPGSDRAYVRIDGEFSPQTWIEGLRTGRSFVSNGPILQLTADGKGVGDTVRLAAPGAAQVVARAWSQFPIQQAEIIYNGKVVATVPGVAAQTAIQFDQAVPFDRSGWLALRVVGPGHADHVATEVYAHTSPLYVEIAGRPGGSPDDARYFLGWIERLWTLVRDRDRFATPGHKTYVVSQVAAARAVYEKIVAGSAAN